MPLSLAEFADQISKSGLLSSAEIGEIVARLPTNRQPGNGDDLASELVSQRKLTVYQVQQLCAGHGESLLLGNYMILDELGKGGMGLVFKARHRRMNRVVALKIQSQAKSTSPESVRRFHREVEAAARLTHPNIVTAYDADEHAGTHFLVMEFIDGRDLAAIVRNRGPLSVRHTVSCVIQAATGLAYAHSRGVIHRDVKPSNLLLDQNGVVKILDMGLARLATPAGEDQSTGSGQVMGTVDFMAPEQAVDMKHVDERADIYSLGVTLWYLLTRRLLYPGETSVQKLLAHQSRSVPSLRAACPAAPPALEAAFERMVAKQPAERFASMREVISALERCRPSKAAATAADSPSTDDGSLRTLLGDALIPADAHELTVGAAGRLPQERTGPAASATMLQSRSEFPTDERVDRHESPALTGHTTYSHADDTPVALVGGNRGRPSRRPAAAVTVIALLGMGALIAGLALGRIRGTTDVGPAHFASSAATAAAGPSVSSAPSPAVVPFDAAAARSLQQSWAKHLRLPVEVEAAAGMKLVLIPPGRFQQGASDEEVAAAVTQLADIDPHWRECLGSEAPRREVQLDRPIYLGTCEVTQRQYREVMGVNPAAFQTGGAKGEASAGLDTLDHPVENVNCREAEEFCARLNQLSADLPVADAAGLANAQYRLPTEAEWEFSCRAGATTPFWSGAADSDLENVGWHKANSLGRTHAVAEARANPFGLFDMHGNVWEWCSDRWPGTGPAEASTASEALHDGAQVSRLVRGGGWDFPPQLCRSAARSHSDSEYRAYNIGFRVVLQPAWKPPEQ